MANKDLPTIRSFYESLWGQRNGVHNALLIAHLNINLITSTSSSGIKRHNREMSFGHQHSPQCPLTPQSALTLARVLTE